MAESDLVKLSRYLNMIVFIFIVGMVKIISYL